jgi:hypothetical protein
MRVLSSLMVAVLCGAAWSAEPTGLPAEYIAEQEFFVGQWRGSGHVGDDEVTIELTARWAPGKHALMIQGKTTRSGQRPERWSLLSGCDASTGDMVDVSFGVHGSMFETRWKTVSETKQVGTEKGIQDGNVLTVQCEAVKHGPDAWTYSSTTGDGKPIKIEYRRMDGLGVPAGSLWEAYRTVATGTWKGEGTITRDNAKTGTHPRGSFRSYLVPDTGTGWPRGFWQCHVRGHRQAASLDYTRILAGWDPDRQQIRFICQWSSGLLEEIILTNQRGQVFLGTYTAKLDGLPTHSARMSVDYTDRDSCVLTFLDGPNKGKVLSTWRRQ